MVIFGEESAERLHDLNNRNAILVRYLERPPAMNLEPTQSNRRVGGVFIGSTCFSECALAISDPEQTRARAGLRIRRTCSRRLDEFGRRLAG